MIQDKITKAKSKLMLENPYFGTLVSSLEFEENNNISSVSNRGDRFIYNSEYFDVLSIEEITTHLANSAMHQALFHSSRGENRVSSIWNLASDYAINSLLVENGFILPPLANYSSRFERLYAEEIYSILLGEVDFDEKEDEIEPEPSKEELISCEDYEILVEQLTTKLQKQGELPKGIERFIDIKREPQISWRDELYRYVNSYAKINYRMFPPNKRYIYQGFALPSIYGEELKVVLAIDTSASIDERLLELFLAEFYEIMEVFPNYIIEFIEVDAKIQRVTRVFPMQLIETNLKGGGGTDFRPVFEYIENLNEDFRFLIYFTDGMGYFPNHKPRVDTLWVMPQNGVEVPFGELLRIKEEDEKKDI
jgi:predicted metal-dependent peptidase